MNNNIMSYVFHKGAYIEGLRRLKVIGIIAAALQVVYGYGLAMLTSFSGGLGLGYGSGVNHIELGNCRIAISISAVIGIPILTLVLFHYLNKRSESDFYHSLPIKRSALLGSGILAVITVYVASVAVYLIMLMVSAALIRDVTINFSTVIRSFLYAIGAAFAMGSVATLAVSLSGNSFSALILMAIIAVFARVIILITLLQLDAMLDYFSIELQFERLIDSNVITWSFAVTDFKAYTAVMSIVESLLYYFIAGFCFVRRDSEISGSSAISRGVQNFARIILTFVVSIYACSCVLTLIFRVNIMGTGITTFYYAIIGVVISAVVYFIFELITTRKWECVRKSLKTLPVVLVMDVIYIGSMYAGITSYRNRTVNPENIRYIEVEKLSWNVDENSLRFDDREVIEAVCECINTYESDRSYSHGWYGTDVKFVERNNSYTRYVRIDERTLGMLYSEYILDNQLLGSAFDTSDLTGCYGYEGTKPVISLFNTYVEEVGNGDRLMYMMNVEEAFAVGAFFMGGKNISFPISYRTPETFNDFISTVSGKTFFYGDFDEAVEWMGQSAGDLKYDYYTYVSIESNDTRDTVGFWMYEYDNHELLFDIFAGMEYEEMSEDCESAVAVKFQIADSRFAVFTKSLTPKEEQKIIEFMEKIRNRD